MALQYPLENARPDLRTGSGNRAGREFHTVHVKTVRRGDFHEVSAGAAHIKQPPRPDARPPISQPVLKCRIFIGLAST